MIDGFANPLQFGRGDDAAETPTTTKDRPMIDLKSMIHGQTVTMTRHGAVMDVCRDSGMDTYSYCPGGQHQGTWRTTNRAGLSKVLESGVEQYGDWLPA